MTAFEGALEVRDLAPGVHVITELNYVHSYLVEGQDWALLVDSGMGKGDINAVAGEITEREPLDGYMILQGGTPEVKDFLSNHIL